MNYDYSLEETLKLIDEDGQAAVRIALRFIFYIQEGYSKKSNIARGVEKYYSMVSPYIKYLVDFIDEKWQAFDEELYQDYLNDLKRSGHSVENYIQFKGGQTLDEADSFHFSTIVMADWDPNATTYLHFSLPVSWFKNYNGIKETFFDFCNVLSPFYAKCGYGLMESLNPDTQQESESEVY